MPIPFDRRFLFACVALCGAGCVSTQEAVRQSLDVPIPAAFASGSSARPETVAAWINDFDDRKLPGLITEAAERNRDLKASAARMRAASADARMTAAGLFPQIETVGNGRRNQRVLTSSSRLVGSGEEITRDRVNDFGLNLNLAWEVDLWGRLRNDTRAAKDDALAAAADYYGAQLSLATNTARGWFNALEGEAQVRLAENTLKSFQSTYKIVDSSYQKGVAGALDVRLAKANVASAVSGLNTRKRERDAAKRTLETLLGRYPSGELGTNAELPPLPAPVPAGIPSELLRRRPDLLAAEARALATVERVKSAKKDLLPAIRLTSGAGLSSDELSELLTLERLVWNIAAGITQPVFQGGRILADIDLQKARNDEAIQLYAQAVLDAFQEVETALAAEQYFRAELDALAVAAHESIKAEELALDEYERGLVEIITVLESQRRSFNSQQSLLQTRNLILQNRLDLYLALGGDFASNS